MAVKPVGVGVQNSGSGSGEEIVFAAPLPTGVSLCQVVVLAINYATSGSPTGNPKVTISEEGWAFVSRAILSGKGMDLYVKVFSGSPVPASVQVTIKWTAATSVFWGSMSEAYDEVSPTTPVEPGSEVFRRPVTTEPICLGITASAGAVGGRVVNGIASNSSAGNITSKEELQEILIPAAPGARCFSQDKTNIVASGPVGVRTYIMTVSSESYTFTLILRPGPAATEPAKPGVPYKRTRSNELGSTGKTEGEDH